MDDYSLLALTSFTKALSASEEKSAASSSATETNGQDFQQMLSMMLLASTMSGSTSSSSSSNSLMGGGDMFSSVMFNLIEQLLAQQSESASAEAQPTPSGAPVEGTLTQAYGSGHNGLDFGVVVGTEIKATMDGEVVYAGWNDQGYGNLVIVQNGDYQTYYAHLSSIPVSVGQKVQANTVIGLSGNTGNSTGPHLHYEVRLDGEPIDPTSFTLA